VETVDKLFVLVVATGTRECVFSNELCEKNKLRNTMGVQCLNDWWVTLSVNYLCKSRIMASSIRYQAIRDRKVRINL
jgi:hypothetical protein